MKQFFRLRWTSWISAASLFTLALPMVSAQTVDTLARIKANNKLVIAYSKTSSPFSFELEGRPVGYSIDICLKVADAIKNRLKAPALKVELLAIPFTDRLEAVKAGTVDIECSNVTQTRERRALYNFSLPHFLTTVKTMVRSDSGIDKIEDMRGKTMTYSTGSVSERAVRELNAQQLYNMKALILKTTPESLAALSDRRADGFVYDEVALVSMRASSARPKDFKLLEKVHFMNPLALVLPKGDTEFKTVVDRELSRIMLDGEGLALYKKWFQSPIPPQNINMDMPLYYLMREHMRWPLDVYVEDVK